jgi:Paraquat-inducible protein A
MKNTKTFLCAFILLISLFLAQRIIFSSLANQQNKRDYAEINHIKYGLFSIDQWKLQISHIMSDEVKKLNLSNSNERDLKKHVEIQLGKLIDNIDQRMRSTNEKTAQGRFKQSLINSFVDLKDIKQGIPGYADAIIVEMTKTKTEDSLKEIVIGRMNKYFNQTFENEDHSQLKDILIRTHSKTIQEARLFLDNEILDKKIQVKRETWILIILSIILFMMPAFNSVPLTPSQYFFFIGSLLILLIVGVTTPMIDMEAKITEMSFTLIDHPIKFVNQVLYFQSKSILDVFWVMVTHANMEMKFVGLLLVLFSIVFPLLKMFSSFLYYFDFRKAQTNMIINFFVLKSGKWSMADVMVVAIFMSYIGFNGIISSQFGQLGGEGQDFVLLSTNGTSLQPGYFLFTTFAVLSLFLSGYLTKSRKV